MLLQIKFQDPSGDSSFRNYFTHFKRQLSSIYSWSTAEVKIFWKPQHFAMNASKTPIFLVGNWFAGDENARKPRHDLFPNIIKKTILRRQLARLRSCAGCIARASTGVSRFVNGLMLFFFIERCIYFGKISRRTFEPLLFKLIIRTIRT